MSRVEKLKQEFARCSGPFPYRDLVTLLHHLGYLEQSAGTGSGRKFVHRHSKHIMRFHEPHPGNEIKAYLVRQIREQLEEQGLL